MTSRSATLVALQELGQGLGDQRRDALTRAPRRPPDAPGNDSRQLHGEDDFRPGDLHAALVPGSFDVAPSLALRQLVTPRQCQAGVGHSHPAGQQVDSGVYPLGYLIVPSPPTLRHDIYILLYMSLGVVDLAPAFLALDVRQRDFELEVRYCVRGVLSPLLANVYLTVLDRAIEALGSRVRLIRYADDCVACVPTEAEAHAVLALISDVIGDLGLELHPDKTCIVGLDRGEGFDFLGFHHQMVGSIRWRSGRRYLHTWPSAKAMNRARARVRFLTNRHMAYLGLEANVEALNRFLRGWGAYFRHGNSGAKFSQLDSYVHLRLARLEMVRHGRRGWGWTTHYRLPWLRAIGVHRLSGTVQWGPTHAAQ
jgi:hypothetical protein